MDSLAVLVPLSVVAVIAIGWVFWRALESGQFDDLDRPGYDILSEDDHPDRRPTENRRPPPQ